MEDPNAVDIGCPEVTVKNMKKKNSSSKKYNRILYCLDHGIHLHMLKYSSEDKTEFEVILVDKKNNKWTRKCISLFEDLDDVCKCPDKRDAKNYPAKTKGRFKSSMGRLTKYFKEVNTIKSETVKGQTTKVYRILKPRLKAEMPKTKQANTRKPKTVCRRLKKVPSKNNIIELDLQYAGANPALTSNPDKKKNEMPVCISPPKMVQSLILPTLVPVLITFAPNNYTSKLGQVSQDSFINGSSQNERLEDALNYVNKELNPNITQSYNGGLQYEDKCNMDEVNQNSYGGLQYEDKCGMDEVNQNSYNGGMQCVDRFSMDECVDRFSMDEVNQNVSDALNNEKYSWSYNGGLQCEDRFSMDEVNQNSYNEGMQRVDRFSMDEVNQNVNDDLNNEKKYSWNYNGGLQCEDRFSTDEVNQNSYNGGMQCEDRFSMDEVNQNVNDALNNEKKYSWSYNGGLQCEGTWQLSLPEDLTLFSDYDEMDCMTSTENPYLSSTVDQRIDSDDPLGKEISWKSIFQEISSENVAE